MKRFRRIFLVIAIATTYQSAIAQDPQFTQFYANPLYLNPALAGSNVCPRICLNYRNQWPAISGTYVTTSASFDRFVTKIKSGLGILVTNDRAGQGTLNTNNVSAVYSHQFRITRNFAINAGLQATYGEIYIDWRKLTFGDMIDDKYGFVYNTNEDQLPSKRSYSDFSAGVLAFSKRIYGGFAVHHITQPDQGLLGSSKLPMKLTVHAGAKIPLNGERGDASISPNIVYQLQGKFNQLDFGFYITKAAVVGGLWYRSNDSFIALIGIQKGMFRCGYSYDITVSKLTNATAGSHELSVALLFHCRKPPKRLAPVGCPTF